MRHIFLFILVISIFVQKVSMAMNYGDTLIVQAITFEDPSPEGWGAQYKTVVNFPQDNETWAKIEMVQWLKCDSATKADKFPCGEWDYIWDSYLKLPMQDTFEIISLGSFVTPYGKRLWMGGEAGWQWTYDVSDYAPLLKGEMELVTGNNQELLNLQFRFIKGTPVRKVLSVENIYPYGNYKYFELADDSVLKQKKIALSSEASGYKLKARISGHGHAGPRNCCEWDSKTHSYYINDWEHFRWNVWKDCGNNAIYPQGGTWPFDRAGWCPGTKVDEYEFELTPKVKPGDTIDFDYGIEYYSDNGEKTGTFRMSHQLVSYGPPNFKYNVAITEILAPNKQLQYSRFNPICGHPEVIIRNNGIHPLKSCLIIYGLKNGDKQEFLWQGDLAFLEQEVILLPTPLWEAFEGNQIFEVIVEHPNGKKDESIIDNRMQSEITWPDKFPSEFTLHILTNNLGRPKENSWIISDPQGTVYYEASDFADSTVYDVPISLKPGCYEFLFMDQMEDGISIHWWNYRDDPDNVGSHGRVRFLDKNGEALKKFYSDFGQELRFNFWVDPEND